MKVVTLRPAQAEDTGFLLRVYASTRSQEMALTGWTDEEKQAFCAMQFDAQRTDYIARFPGAVQSIVLEGGKPAGQTWVYRSDEEIRLLDIALLPERRNSGTGAILLLQLQDEARRAGKPLRHSVYKDNEDALRFYRRLGFAVVADFEAYCLMEWNPGAA
jgi:ribosomal protein S18 acetylase RimI-like enzyme